MSILHINIHYNIIIKSRWKNTTSTINNTMSTIPNNILIRNWSTTNRYLNSSIIIYYNTIIITNKNLLIHTRFDYCNIGIFTRNCYVKCSFIIIIVIISIFTHDENIVITISKNIFYSNSTISEITYIIKGVEWFTVTITDNIRNTNVRCISIRTASHINNCIKTITSNSNIHISFRYNKTWSFINQITIMILIISTDNSISTYI